MTKQAKIESIGRLIVKAYLVIEKRILIDQSINHNNKAFLSFFHTHLKSSDKRNNGWYYLFQANVSQYVIKLVKNCAITKLEVSMFTSRCGATPKTIE